MQLTPNFSRQELERDGCVIPEESVVGAYKALCEAFLEPIRAHFGEVLHITSGYRSPEVNARIGGAKDSQHVATGEHCAVDFFFESYRVAMNPVFDWIRLGSLPFDQVILEHGKYGDVIHISWVKTNPRRMALEGATFNKAPYEARYVAKLQNVEET